MNYLRKIVAIVLTILFCIAVIIGICVAFAVRNVNVEFISYTGAYTEEYEQSKQELRKFKGTNLFYLSEEQLRSSVVGDNIALQSYEKVFPCTVNVVIKERMETFAVKTDSGFDVFDEDGVFLKSSSLNKSNIDGCPNVLLNVREDKIATAMQACLTFKDRFSRLRSAVASVEIREADHGVESAMTFKLYSGLTVILIDYENYPQEKISAVYQKFCELSERQKLCGTIYASAPGGQLAAVGAAYSD